MGGTPVLLVRLLASGGKSGGGEIGHKEKVRLLSEVDGVLFSSRWNEAFGLVMIEALACGTSVVAFRRGSVPEIIQDGVNGFIVDSVNEMAKAVKKVGIISPAKCRKSVEKRFSIERMVNEYENLFKKLVYENGDIFRRSGGNSQYNQTASPSL